jgi:hypothetical protein
LVQFDQASIQRSGADGHVKIFKRRKQFIGFVDGRRKIRVREKRDISLGLEHAVAHAETLAAIARV